MALAYDGAIQRLIDAFAHLPGIGPKGAQTHRLLPAQRIRRGSADPGRRHHRSQGKNTILRHLRQRVRNQPMPGLRRSASRPQRDLRGRRAERRDEHRAHARIPRPVPRARRRHQPDGNVQPSDLNIAKLIERLKDSEVTEVILALNPNVEGEATTSFLSQLLSQTDIKVTRLASGLPVGGDLEYADEITLGRALAGRRAV